MVQDFGVKVTCDRCEAVIDTDKPYISMPGDNIFRAEGKSGKDYHYSHLDGGEDYCSLRCFILSINKSFRKFKKEIEEFMGNHAQ